MFSSLYPSVIREYNIAPNTLIGMVIIAHAVHNKENKCSNPQWTRAGAYMEDLQSNVWMEFCARWHNFPRYETLYNDVIEFFGNIMIPQNGCLRKYDRNGCFNPIVYDCAVDRYGYPININKKRLIQPIKFDDQYNHQENPIVYFDRDKIMEALNNVKHSNQLFRKS